MNLIYVTVKCGYGVRERSKTDGWRRRAEDWPRADAGIKHNPTDGGPGRRMTADDELSAAKKFLGVGWLKKKAGKRGTN